MGQGIMLSRKTTSTSSTFSSWLLISRGNHRSNPSSRGAAREKGRWNGPPSARVSLGRPRQRTKWLTEWSLVRRTRLQQKKGMNEGTTTQCPNRQYNFRLMNDWLIIQSIKYSTVHSTVVQAIWMMWVDSLHTPERNFNGPTAMHLFDALPNPNQYIWKWSEATRRAAWRQGLNVFYFCVCDSVSHCYWLGRASHHYAFLCRRRQPEILTSITAMRRGSLPRKHKRASACTATVVKWSTDCICICICNCIFL